MSPLPEMSSDFAVISFVILCINSRHKVHTWGISGSGIYILLVEGILPLSIIA